MITVPIMMAAVIMIIAQVPSRLFCKLVRDSDYFTMADNPFLRDKFTSPDSEGGGYIDSGPPEKSGEAHSKCGNFKVQQIHSWSRF
jgi:hypothetical protein